MSYEEKGLKKWKVITLIGMDKISNFFSTAGFSLASLYSFASLLLLFHSFTRRFTQSYTLTRSLSPSFFPFLSTPMSYQPFSFTHFRSSFFLRLALSTYQSHARSFLFSLLVSFTRPHDRGQEVEVRELGSLVYSCVSSLRDLYQWQNKIGLE